MLLSRRFELQFSLIIYLMSCFKMQNVPSWNDSLVYIFSGMCCSCWCWCYCRSFLRTHLAALDVSASCQRVRLLASDCQSFAFRLSQLPMLVTLLKQPSFKLEFRLSWLRISDQFKNIHTRMVALPMPSPISLNNMSTLLATLCHYCLILNNQLQQRLQF